MTTPKMVEEQGAVVEFVPEAKQKEAMQFLQQQLFNTPRWLVDNNISSYTGSNKLTVVGNIQNVILNRLVSNATLTKLFRAEAELQNPYTATEMLNDLRSGVWSELATRKPVDIYRRALQKSHVESLGRIINPDATGGLVVTSTGISFAGTTSKTSDAISVAKSQLRALQTEIRAALPTYKDAASRAHLQDVLDRIQQTLDPTK
jgi:hypothetical protein